MGKPDMTDHAMRRDATMEPSRAPDQATPDIRRLERAVEYLLISQLNVNASLDVGPRGNARLVDLFVQLLTALDPAIFLDIGANDGSTAAKVKAMRPDCRVVAYEANPAIHALFLERLSAVGVHYLNRAVAAHSGLVTIFAPRTLSKAYVGGEIIDLASVEPLDTGKSSLLKRNEDATYDEYAVDAIALDDSFGSRDPESNRRDIALWIDVEGAAHDVLIGAAETLKRTSVIFIESENHTFWSNQKQCGDIARKMIGAGFLPLQRDREYGDKQFNTIFIHYSLIDIVYPKVYALDQTVRPAREISSPTVAPPAAKPGFRSLAACLIAEIPVFVPVFNNPTYASKMLGQLKHFGIKNIFLVDNNSSYDGMHAFLDRASSEATIIRLGENKGPHDLILSDTNYACLPDIFCVTDPDLEFRSDMPQDFLFDLLSLTNKFEVGKAGLALDLSDAEHMNREKFLFGGQHFHIWEWEIQFWRNRIDAMGDGSPVFKADIDTTFALYNKKYFRRESFYDAVRVAGRYACRHLPWYTANQLPPHEDAVYRATQKFSYHMI